MVKSRALQPSSLLEGIGAAVYVVDAQRRVVYVNRACAALLGEAADRLLGVAMSFHSTASPEPLELLSGGLCPPPEVFEGKSAEATVAVPMADGTVVERRVRWLPSHDGAGQLQGVLGLIAEPPDGGDACQSRASADTPDDVHDELARLRRKLAASYGFDQLICQSAAMRTVLEQVRLAAGCDVPVLICGERGTGKELVARTIHYASRRRDAPLVPLDCIALPADVLERTLRRLLLPLAEGEPQYLRGLSLEGGTLLVQEVTALPRDGQALVCGQQPEPGSDEMPVRLLATTAGDLAQARADGKLREGLYLALRTLVIELPPLRDRLDDLPLLAQHFLEQQNARGGHQVGSIAAEALDVLQSYPWPGNVRELAETIAAAHEHATSSRIELADLPRRLRSAVDAAALGPSENDEPIPLEEQLIRTETELIRRALARAKGNKSRAADLLGISRPRLYRRMEQLGIEEAAGEQGEVSLGDRS